MDGPLDINRKLTQGICGTQCTLHLIHKFSKQERSVIRSETILISNISSSFSFFDRDRQPMMYTICLTHLFEEDKLQEGPGSCLIQQVLTFWAALFCFIFKFCLHLGGYDSSLSNNLSIASCVIAWYVTLKENN